MKESSAVIRRSKIIKKEEYMKYYDYIGIGVIKSITKRDGEYEKNDWRNEYINAVVAVSYIHETDDPDYLKVLFVNQGKEIAWGENETEEQEDIFKEFIMSSLDSYLKTSFIENVEQDGNTVTFYTHNSIYTVEMMKGDEE